MMPFFVITPGVRGANGVERLNTPLRKPAVSDDSLCPNGGKMKHARLIFLVLAAVAALAAFVPARAGATAHFTVNDCSNDTVIRSALINLQSAGGGLLDFNCGTASITLTSELPEIYVNTIIDGANKIKLSGNDAVRLF